MTRSGMLVAAILVVFVQGCAEAPMAPSPALASVHSSAGVMIDPCETSDCNSGGGSGDGLGWPFFGTPGDNLYQAAYDPSPSAPGIWLGASVTPDVCYANRNPAIVDVDKDWLDDRCELELARGFAPTWDMSINDGCPGGEPLWAAKYHNVPGVVRIAYLPAYYDDCGGTRPYDHRGDSEFVMVQVIFNFSTRHWEFQTMWMSAHYSGGINDRSRWLTPQQTTFTRRYLAHPYVLVAERKHSNYPNASECGDGITNPDDCTPSWGALPWRMPVNPARNLGSRFVARVPCIASYGAMANSGRSECFYSEDRKFCGWHLTSTTCPTSYYYFLMSGYFERYGDYDWGPGPLPPSSPPPSGGGGTGPLK